MRCSDNRPSYRLPAYYVLVDANATVADIGTCINKLSLLPKVITICHKITSQLLPLTTTFNT